MCYNNFNLNDVKKQINGLVIKCLYILLFLSLITIFSCGNSPYKNAIYGEWEGEYRGQELLFKFENDQTCTLSFKDKISGSVELLNGKFEIDFTKNPIPLSVKNIPQLNHPLYTIIEFTRYNEIKIASFAIRWRLRPFTFDSKTSMILKRIKEKK